MQGLSKTNQDSTGLSRSSTETKREEGLQEGRSVEEEYGHGGRRHRARGVEAGTRIIIETTGVGMKRSWHRYEEEDIGNLVTEAQLAINQNTYSALFEGGKEILIDFSKIKVEGLRAQERRSLRELMELVREIMSKPNLYGSIKIKHPRPTAVKSATKTG